VVQAQAPPKKRRGPGLLAFLLAVLAGLFILGKMSGGPTTTQSVNSSPPTLKSVEATSPSHAPEKVLPDLPAGEKEFIRITIEKAAAYRAAPNDLAKGGIRNARKVAICNGLPSPQVQDWIGTIYNLSSNNEGKGVLEVQISHDVYIKTWNNSFSDIGDQTLIDPNSDLFRTLSNLKGGSAIKFSGSFLPSDTDCIREGSLTQSGSMTEPEFLMKFNRVEPL
jgi:hypothetical protein